MAVERQFLEISKGNFCYSCDREKMLLDANRWLLGGYQYKHTQAVTKPGFADCRCNIEENEITLQTCAYKGGIEPWLLLNTMNNSLQDLEELCPAHRVS